MKKTKIDTNPCRLNQKKKRQEVSKRWYNNQSPEKKEDLRQKARKYHKNRYHNLMVEVK